jgi:hypothetical protein
MVTEAHSDNIRWEILEEDMKMCQEGEAHIEYSDALTLESRRKDLRIYRSSKDFEVGLAPQYPLTTEDWTLEFWFSFGIHPYFYKNMKPILILA